MKQKCVFLDRDGVLNQDSPHYIYRAEDYVILEGVIEGLRRMKDAGYLLIVVTNQAGIAKGLYTREDVRKCHSILQEQSGNLLDDLYFAPHHPDFSSNTLMRKPNSLMLEKAMAKYNIDASQSWMVGDKPSDIEAGRRAGVRTIHVVQQASDSVGDACASNFWAIAQTVLQQ